MSMRVPAKIYPITIPAGGSFPLLAVGSYFKVLDAAGTFEVAGDAFGTLGAIQAGQGLRMDDGSMFTRVTFRDTSGSANNLRVLVAGDGFIDDRITGEVAVIDGEKARTLAGGMFAGAPSSPAVAANYSAAGLYNGATSGKNVIVPAASVSVPVTMAVNYYLLNASLATNQGATNSANKLSTGGLSSAASVRVDAFAALPVSRILWGGYCPANQVTPWDIRGAVVLSPGWALVAIGNTVNTQIAANFEWFEELVP